MLTATQAAERFDKPRQWLSKLAKEGRIKGVKRGFNGYQFPETLVIKPVKLGRPRKADKGKRS